MSNHTAPIPQWLTADYMEETLKNTNHFRNLKVHSIEISPGSSAGDNYACQILRIRLKINNDGKDEEISIIGKHEPKTELLESMEDVFDVFKTEAYFFEHTLPEMNKKLSTPITPQCYGIDSKHKIIFQEDLKASNFVMHDKTKAMFLNLEESILTVETLASFHGASFSLIDNDQNLKEVYKNAFWSSKTNIAMEKLFLNAQKAIKNFIGLYNLPESQSKGLLRLSEKLTVDFCKVCDLEDGKLNVLLHGDSWKNNLMFNYDNGDAKAVKLVDFQWANYNCFANDLQYVLFSSVSSDVVIDSLDLILEKYFNKLKSIGSHIPNLTLERIKKEFSERLYFGLVLSIVFRASILSEEPMDIEKLFADIFLPLGYNTPQYISDLQKFLSFFEENGVL